MKYYMGYYCSVHTRYAFHKFLLFVFYKFQVQNFKIAVVGIVYNIGIVYLHVYRQKMILVRPYQRDEKLYFAFLTFSCSQNFKTSTQKKKV